jgi:hypothetical protein
LVFINRRLLCLTCNLRLAMSMRNHRLALLGGVALMALAAMCALGIWMLAQPGMDVFVLSGARDIRHESLGPGLLSMTFNYEGSVQAQSARLQSALKRQGWSTTLDPVQCGGPCLLGGVVFLYTRTSSFNIVHEVATIEQRGAGPYRVRVVLRRCYQLPGMACWPRG